MQGLAPHGAGPGRMVCSSARFGSRQSHCPAKHVPFSDAAIPPRKFVNAVPSAALPVADQEYVLLSSWTLASLVFFSHWSAVRLSVIVPSPLSTNRLASHVAPVPLA